MSLISLHQFRADALNAIRTGNFQSTPDGIWIPDAGLRIAGHFEAWTEKDGLEVAPNIVVTEGINHILAVALAQGAQKSAFYLALFGGNVTPVNTVTGATFASSATEFTNYTEPTRVLWAEDAVNAGAVGNASTPGVFTIGAGGGTVRGAALVEAQAKSAATGVLVAYARFAQDKVMTQGEELRLTYTITGTST